ncbi:uncharacterized protein [Amphiura filiformis]|uniref:uncharacterized protein n=1 Tax=Amphiura filiformis TaxID=82378 RepID=UPI003B20DB9D
MAFVTRMIMLAAAVAVFQICVCTSNKHKLIFKRLTKKEVSPILLWPSAIDSPVHFKNCGPKFSLSFSPWPLDFNQIYTMAFNFTVEHTVMDGDFNLNINRWPYHWEDNFCDYMQQRVYDTPVCPLKKGDTYYIVNSGLYLDIPEIYMGNNSGGNITIINSKEEVLLCFSFVLT